MYYAKVNWYDEYNEKDIISHIIICASNWNDAMQKINNSFTWLNSIEMRQVQAEEVDVVFINEDAVESILKENDW